MSVYGQIFQLISLKYQYLIWHLDTWAELFEGQLVLNPGFFFLCSKAFSRIIFCPIFKASDYQLVDKKN